MCRVLREHDYAIAPSTYYLYKTRHQGPTAHELTDAYDARRLYLLWVDNRRAYGKQKLWKAACRSEWKIGRDRVAWLMKLCGIQGVRRGRQTTSSTVADPGRTRWQDHVHHRWDAVSAPDQLWVADFTYVWTQQGFC